MSMIRATSLTNFEEVVAELGGNGKALLYRAGIEPRTAGDPDAFVPYRSLVIAVEAAAATTHTPDFGRRLALRQGIEILGPVGVAARTAPTVGDALRICSSYIAAYSPTVEVRVAPEDDHALLEIAIRSEGLPPHPQTYELSLGIALRVLRHFRGDEYRPLAVQVPHSPITDERDYRAYYGCTPRFDQHQAGFLIRDSDLAAPLTDDPLAHQAVVRYLESTVTAVGSGLTRPVGDLVRRLLPTGAVTLEVVATQFALHPKTLQRRLTAEGTTFGAVVEQVRREVVERYLRDSDLSLTQVAREVGYSEQSVLTRSCRRWYGSGPAAVRRTLRATASH